MTTSTPDHTPDGASDGLRVETADGVLRLTLDRPETLNALTLEIGARVVAELEGAIGRDDVRVVVLAGAGGAFSAGADIGGEQAHERFSEANMTGTSRMVRAITRCDKPVVASVEGVAAGVAVGLILACDLAVLSESASLHLAFARIGLMPDGGTTATLAAGLGRARAMRVALLGESLTAREAFDAGLVSHCVADSDHAAELERVLTRLRRGAPLAQAATKRAVNAAAYDRLDEALESERTGQTVLLRTADAAEGMRAFSERRRPEFRGE